MSALEVAALLKPALALLFLGSIIFLARAMNQRRAVGLLRLSPSSQLIAAVLTVGSLGLGVTAIFSGNLTFFLSSILFAALLSSGWPARNWAYPLAVLVASIVKPYLLLYLIPFVLTAAPKRRLQALLLSFGCATAFCLIWFSALVIDPQMFSSFMAALKQQTLVKNDLGFSLPAYLVNRIGFNQALLVQLAVVSASLAYWFMNVRGKLHNSVLDFKDVRVSQIYLSVVVTLANPRMKEYDFALAFFLVAVLLISLRLGSALKWLFASQVILASGAVAIAVNGSANLPLILVSYPLYYLAAFCVLLVPLVVVGHRNSTSRRLLTHEKP